MTKAGEITRKYVEDIVCESTYNNPERFLENIYTCIPKPLKVYLDAVTSKKRKSQKPETLKKK